MAKQLKEIEIPFGAKDSELYGWEYTIPEGMEAKIVDNKIVVKKKESKNEKIRQLLIRFVKYDMSNNYSDDFSKEDCLAWLEKQGEHADFLNKIQIGDKVTRNEDGVLVNLSQLKRVAKPAEKQGEQKPDETEKGAKGNEREIPNSAWSEEDKGVLLESISVLQSSSHLVLADKLKSLKDKVQPKQEWSEEDKKILNLIIARLHSHPNVEAEEYDKDYHWLKSLK